MDEKKPKKTASIILCAVSVLLLIVLLFPLFWTLVTSLKTEKEIFLIPPTWYPHELNTKSYAAQIETGDFNM
ncbi:MAG: carbohydrate ABC transporter permease, partial [Lachnospiraceae bacterium]|nr:carbohydrate ABC transporter permease [Lachnospiraceae bacterium]